MRGTEKMFELVDNIKKILEDINFYISIYPGAGVEAGDIKFLKEYKMSAERAGRKIMTNMKNSAHL
jgi:hypothetical protein